LAVPHAACRHLLLNAVADPRQVVDVLADGARRCHHVGVVKAEVRQAQSSEKLEGFIQLLLGSRLIHGPAVPGPVERPGPEHVGALGAERMPIADRHAQVVFHSLAEHDPVLIVITKGQRVLRMGALEPDGRNACEVRL